MKGEMKILDRSGHSTVTWDTEVETGPLSPAFVESEFERLVSEGHLAFVKQDGENVQIKDPKDFDPSTMDQVTMVPAFQGG